MIPMAEKIYELVRTRRHVSFVEPHRMIPGFTEKQKNTMTILTLPSLPQVIIWIDVSKEASEALNELIISRKIFLRPCHWLIYVCDGGWLNFPILKKRPRKNSKKHYWLPCVLDIEPFGGEDKKAKGLVCGRQKCKE